MSKKIKKKKEKFWAIRYYYHLCLKDLNNVDHIISRIFLGNKGNKTIVDNAALC